MDNIHSAPWKNLQPGQPAKHAVARPGSGPALREALGALRAYEWITLAYLLALSGLIAAFPHRVGGAAKYLALHAGIAAAMVALCWAERRFANRFLRFCRHWYPFALFIFFFEELHYLSWLIHSRWFDPALLRFDYALFGTQPALWFEAYASPVLNDVMAFSYATYYFYTVILAGALYIREEMPAFRITMLGTAIAYIFGYCIALAWPMEGPYHTLRHLQKIPQLEGYFFTALMNLVQGAARVHGAAFPSLHVAGATVAVLGAWRFRRSLFWIFLPLYGAMLIATVYGRYHYFADLPAGFLAGLVGFQLARFMEARDSC